VIPLALQARPPMPDPLRAPLGPLPASASSYQRGATEARR
jgi:hypothetical protein